jgi:hypothetical protein
MSDKYDFRINVVDANTVEVIVEDKKPNDGGKSGNVDLYYAGSETPTDLPELIDSIRVLHVDWGEDLETPNLADGETLVYGDVPTRYIEGNGEFILYFGADPEPVARVSAEEARDVETEGTGDRKPAEPASPAQRKAAGLEHETRERKTRAKEHGVGKITKQVEDDEEDLDVNDAIDYIAEIFGVELPDPEDLR